MGQKYKHWLSRSNLNPTNLSSIRKIITSNRSFKELEQLDYGDHGLETVRESLISAIEGNKKIVMYADYDVDGTMSAVSWIWFLEALGYKNYSYYIPDRLKEGYGVNLDAIKHLIHDAGADLIITMDTGITANAEAVYCKEHGVDFICTDHHVIQEDKMPDCKILNPKQHPDPEYQELCGAGITYVLLRSLSKHFHIDDNEDLWRDLLALAGIATISDMVTLNAVNHRLARLGIRALTRSKRNVFRALLSLDNNNNIFNESSIGFGIAPRINAVGRLNHADAIVKAFCENDPAPLVGYMDSCNLERKEIQKMIVATATQVVEEHYKYDPLLFVGHDEFHCGVVGIAATRLMDDYWRPTFIYDSSGDTCKGSARGIKGFDILAAMQYANGAGNLFTKFGGHVAAGGFSFPKKNEKKIRNKLLSYAGKLKRESPELWESKIYYDSELPTNFIGWELVEILDDLRPYGLGFPEPLFLVTDRVRSVKIYKKAHTAVFLVSGHKVMLFNQVHNDLVGKEVSFIVSVHRNTFAGRTSIDLIAKDHLIVDQM